jgi:excinuclease ABC subunit A
MPNSKRDRVPPDDGFMHVRGARQHNLRNIDVDLPRNALVAFTGVSGSGKSSLAFGTIYAEAQRRYFESVAPYARRLIHQMEVPKVGEITGLPPAVALQQRRGSPSSRSTVGTLTTLSNLVRMLYSRAGSYPAGAPRLEAEAFSPNTATGACVECQGLGTTVTVTEELMVPDATLTIREGAVAAWPKAWQGVNLRDILTTLGYDVDKPWSKLSRKQRTWILFTDEQPVVLVHPSADRNEGEYYGRFWSARSYVMHSLATTTSETMRDRAMRFVERIPCPVCGGSGLRPEALTVTFAGLNIHELNHVPLRDLAEVLGSYTKREHAGRASQGESSSNVTGAASTIVLDVLSRVQVLLKLGLGYLSLSRATPTLSAGEMQRLRLATQLRSGLFGIVYVLDEPSAGLHPADAEPLLEVLDQLKTAGNSLFVVEHDMDIVRNADWVVDIGPGAGEHGGRVLYSGPVAGLAGIKSSATSHHLFSPPPRFHATPRAPAAWLQLGPIDRHNLHDVTVNVPVGLFTAVTGVSGSGKSTLVTQVLVGTVARHLGVHDEGGGDVRMGAASDGDAAALARGLDPITRLVRVDQRPIGRTPRSNLATYTGLFDTVRKQFATTDEAVRRGYTAGRFSFNVTDGRCATCQGEGFVSVELLFLPSTYAPCPTCGGSRFNPETLEITWNGKNIGEVLELTVDEAREFFASLANVGRSLQTLHEVGLGYLRIGQPATDLSGGEAQRVKLASELQRVQRGHTLYVLDEPTTGLHPADIELLAKQLHRLVDTGNTVVVVEHDLDIIANADWIIDLGPGAGDEGGNVVSVGPPDTFAQAPDSRTSPYLVSKLSLH